MGNQNVTIGHQGQTSNGTIAGAMLVSAAVYHAHKNAAWAICKYSRKNQALAIYLSKTYPSTAKPLREGGNLLECPIKIEQLATPQTNALIVDLLRAKSVYDDQGTIELTLPAGMANTVIDTINNSIESAGTDEANALLRSAVEQLKANREGLSACVRDTYDLTAYSNPSDRLQLLTAAGVPVPKVRGTKIQLLSFDA